MRPWYISVKRYEAWRERVKLAIEEQKLHEGIHRAVPESRTTTVIATHIDLRAISVAQRLHRLAVLGHGKRVRKDKDGEAKWPKWIRALLDEEVAREWGEG